VGLPPTILTIGSFLPFFEDFSKKVKQICSGVTRRYTPFGTKILNLNPGDENPCYATANL